MKQFYQGFLNCTLLGEFPSAALLRAGVGSGKRIQMLGLLQRSIGLGPGRDAARRIAFILSAPERERERKRLEGLGIRVYEMEHNGGGKPSWCFRDPEGNEVELLCCDPTLND